MVELMDQVHWKVLGRTQQKFKDRSRAGVSKAKGLDDNLIADADEMPANRSLLQYRKHL